MGLRSWVRQLVAEKPAPRGPKMRSVFAAAQQNRLTRDFLNNWMSGKQELKYELHTLRMRSREVCRNGAIGQRYLGLCDENVLGHEGIVLQMRMVTRTGEPDEESNERIEAAWAEWGQLGQCTLDGRYSWREFEGATLEQVARDGEGLVELVGGAKNDYGFAVQLIDPDRFNEQLTQFGTNAVTMGVETDLYDRPVALHLYSQHPMDAGGQRRTNRVPVDRILHFGRHRRVGQVRYEPWVTPVLMTMKMLEEYLFTELVSSRVAAGKMGVIIPSIDAPGPDPDLSPEEQETTFEAEPGTWITAPAGSTVHDSNPTHPGDQFQTMVDGMMRQIASGLHVSVAGLSGDYTKVNYSSGRLASLAERDRWRVLQRWYSQNLHQRVFAKWLEWAVLRKKVRLPGTLQEAVRAATWEFRGWPWVDPEKDGNATAKEVSMGLNDLITAAAEKGRDFEATVKNQARAMKIAQKYGVQITLDVPEQTVSTTTDATNGSSDAGDGAEPADAAPKEEAVA